MTKPLKKSELRARERARELVRDTNKKIKEFVAAVKAADLPPVVVSILGCRFVMKYGADGTQKCNWDPIDELVWSYHKDVTKDDLKTADKAARKLGYPEFITKASTMEVFAHDHTHHKSTTSNEH